MDLGFHTCVWSSFLFVWQVFYGHSEPTFILNNQQPLVPHRYPPPHRGEMVRPLQDYPQDMPPPGYRTKALVGPQNGAVSRIMHQSPVCSCCLPPLPLPLGRARCLPSLCNSLHQSVEEFEPELRLLNHFFLESCGFGWLCSGARVEGANVLRELHREGAHVADGVEWSSGSSLRPV